MTLDELMEKVLGILPNATIDEDNEGQLVVYTNLHVVSAAGETPVYVAELTDK